MIPLAAKYHGSAPKDENSAVPETGERKNSSELNITDIHNS